MPGTVQTIRLNGSRHLFRPCVFLAGKASCEGGLRANDRAPLADLLSTFTAAWTLDQLGALARVDAEQVRRFAQSLERPKGSFQGGLWNNGCNAQCTFYGLGVLALFWVAAD